MFIFAYVILNTWKISKITSTYLPDKITLGSDVLNTSNLQGTTLKIKNDNNLNFNNYFRPGSSNIWKFVRTSSNKYNITTARKPGYENFCIFNNDQSKPVLGSCKDTANYIWQIEI